MNSIKSVDAAIKDSHVLDKTWKEIDSLWKSRKHQDFFTTEEIKKIELKIIYFLEEFVKYLGKMKDKRDMNKIKKNIYILTYDYYLNDDSELSEPVNELFFLFQKDISLQSLLKSIKNVRKELLDMYSA